MLPFTYIYITQYINKGSNVYRPCIINIHIQKIVTPSFLTAKYMINWNIFSLYKINKTKINIWTKSGDKIKMEYFKFYKIFLSFKKLIKHCLYHIKISMDKVIYMDGIQWHFPILLYLVIFKHGFQRVRYYHPKK